jgi:hypothetical protein
VDCGLTDTEEIATAVPATVIGTAELVLVMPFNVALT